MPPAIVAAGIGAAATLGGAALASRASNKATSAQMKSNADTLAYTKQKDAQAQADALRREGLWQQQQNQWRTAANQALANWGFQGSLSPISGYGQQTPMGSAQIPQGAVRRPTRSPYADAIAPQAAEDTPGTRDLRGEVGDWSDWRNYGLR